MKEASATRIRMAAIGALAGVAFWLLADVLPDRISDGRIVMLLAAGFGAFFSAMLAVSGPMNTARAAVVGLAVSVAPALLLYWASFRFDTTEQFVETGHPLLAFAVLAALPVPFLVAGLGPERNWRDYSELFGQSWGIVVRYIAAWLFTGLFWAVIFLSSQLFGTIGLDLIENLLEIEPLPYVLSGLVFGLALAVVNELSDYLSPYLVLRLLRLLLPVVLVVVSVFVVMVPFRGLTELFGALSSAGILLAMAIGGVSLVSVAIDRSDDEAVASPFMRFAAQALSLVIPVLAGLAVWAIWLRVVQHGWSPDRIAATTIAGIVLLYSVFYALAVLRRRDWTGQIRRFNTALALVVIGIAALWLTPAMNPQRISSKDQFARYVDGRTNAAQLDLWTVAREWGRAGQRVASEFGAVEGEGQALMRDKLAALENAATEEEYERDLSGPESDRMQEFLSAVPIRPDGVSVPEDVFGEYGSPAVWLDACARRTAAGNPGCAMVVADFLREAPGNEVLLLTKQTENWVRAEWWRKNEEGIWVNHGFPGRLYGPAEPIDDEAMIDRIIAGDFALTPVTTTAIRLGGTDFIMLP